MMEIKSNDISELKKIKNIINVIVNLLEYNINLIKENKFELDENQKELFSFLIGSKENVVSIITKLSNLLMKMNEIKEDSSCDDIKLEDIDIEIINKFLKERLK